MNTLIVLFVTFSLVFFCWYFMFVGLPAVIDTGEKYRRRKWYRRQDKFVRHSNHDSHRH